MKTTCISRLFVLLCLFFFCENIYCQDNPLFSGKAKHNNVPVADSVSTKQDLQKTSIHKKPIRIKVVSNFIKKNAHLQKQIKSRFFALANEYKTNKSLRGICLIFFFSFLYGILHSLGPGHGKVFIFSYILTEKPRVLKAIGISYLIAAVHAISGLIAALIIILTLNTYSSSSVKISGASNIIMSFSFALIILLGISLLVKAIRKNRHHEHGISGKKEIVPFVLSVGIVPCPGTIIIVSFLASLGLLCIGITSVVFIILGMGVSISAIGLLSLFSKKLVLRMFHENSESYEKLFRCFSFLGALLLILLGTWFFIGSIAL